MPFDHSLVAIQMKDGDYSVHSQLSNAWLAVENLKDPHKVDVSQDNIFQDYVAPLAVWQAKQCLPKEAKDAARIEQWLDSLPSSVYFPLMHSAEFETGYSD